MSAYTVLAICSQGCYNGGTCFAPGRCACTSGWTGTDCRSGKCWMLHAIMYKK